jgi:hypothetical protein
MQRNTLTSSTVLTLVVLPVLYALLKDSGLPRAQAGVAQWALSVAGDD